MGLTRTELERKGMQGNGFAVMIKKGLGGAGGGGRKNGLRFNKYEQVSLCHTEMQNVRPTAV